MWALFETLKCSISLLEICAGCSFVLMSSSIPWNMSSRVPGIYFAIMVSYSAVSLNVLIFCTFSVAFEKFDAVLSIADEAPILSKRDTVFPSLISLPIFLCILDAVI